jgi:magnesium and cobalt transporter
MSSNPDPSSPAAHGAQNDEDEIPGQRPGLLARLFGATPQDTTDSVNGTAPDKGVPNGTGTRAVGLSNLRRLRVEDVAIPRAEIVSVPCDISLPELLETFRSSGLTRLPVYDGTLDVPVGLVHLKDIALRYGFQKDVGGFALRTTLRPLALCAAVDADRRVADQDADGPHAHGAGDRRVWRRRRACDHRGPDRTGHRRDRGRTRRRRGAPLPARGRGRVAGLARTPLDEFEAELGVDLSGIDDEEEVDTLGGLVFLLTGRVPARGEVVPHPSGVEFEVIDADPRRIKRLRVRAPKSATGA